LRKGGHQTPGDRLFSVSGGVHLSHPTSRFRINVPTVGRGSLPKSWPLTEKFFVETVVFATVKSTDQSVVVFRWFLVTFEYVHVAAVTVRLVSTFRTECLDMEDVLGVRRYGSNGVVRLDTTTLFKPKLAITVLKLIFTPSATCGVLEDREYHLTDDLCVRDRVAFTPGL